MVTIIIGEGLRNYEDTKALRKQASIALAIPSESLELAMISQRDNEYGIKAVCEERYANLVLSLLLKIYA